MSQTEKELEFHKSRISFAVCDTLRVTLFDGRNRYEWLGQEYGMSREEVNEIVTGYMRPVDGEPGVVNIVYYTGENYDECGPLDDGIIEELKAIAYERLNADNVRICTGVVVGEVGEVWPVKNIIGMYAAC